MGWLGKLPPDIIATRSRLALLDAWLSHTTVRLEQVTKRLADAEHALSANSAAEREPLDVEMSVIKAMVCNFEGDLPHVIELSETTLARLDKDQTLVRGIVLGNLGRAYANSGQVVPAARAFAQATELGEQTGQTFLGLISLAYLGEIQVQQGHLQFAERSFTRAIEWAAENGLERLAVSALANVGMGALLYEWDRLVEAKQYVEIGIADCERQDLVLTGWSGVALLNGYLTSARISAGEGQFDQAEETLAQAQTLVRRQMPSSERLVAAAQAQLSLARKYVVSAAKWGADAGLQADDEPLHARESEYLLLARLLIAQGRADEAKGLLDALEEGAARSGRGGIVTHVPILKALSYDACGEEEASLAVLKHALKQA